ncbi:MAG: FAD-binding protein [candidate division KSB1 bacterium]|nr:FAD-binding protein [candidate division KSB1 bacterium]
MSNQLDRRFLKQVERVVGRENVHTDPESLKAYSYDASLEEGKPDAVVFVTSTDQVAGVVRAAYRWRVPYVARGSGTCLSGGPVPWKGGLVLEMSRMNRVLEIDPRDRSAWVEAGVFNLQLQQALKTYGFTFAPDPASQKVSTLGGNFAENAGGPHCLKYGVTSHHILAAEVVWPDGSVEWVDALSHGYDLLGLLIGSEGTLGVVTSLRVRIIPLPEGIKTMLAVFDSLLDAADAVSAIIAQGILPATLEMMDRTTIQVVEDSMAVGYPRDSEAVLVIEVDGPKAGLEEELQAIEAICRQHRVREIRVARDEREREALWAGRRGAYGAMTRIQPSTMVADGTVPRSKLPYVLKRVNEIAQKYGLIVGNLLHAGDGNLHPNIVFDARDPDQRRRAQMACAEILRVCVEAGGTISGEHGIGLEKREAMTLVFGPEEIRLMREIKRKFDPLELANPGKILPDLPGPGEQGERVAAPGSPA